jgi:hypothetical protein
MPAISTTTRSHCIPGRAPATVHCAARKADGKLTNGARPAIADRADQP